MIPNMYWYIPICKFKIYRKCLYSNSDGGFGHSDCDNTHADQYWKFIIEPYKVIDVSFDLNLGQIINSNPSIIGGGKCDNSNDFSNEQVSIVVTETITESSSFSYTHGFYLPDGTTFTTQIPFIDQGLVSTTLSSADHSYIWGSNTSIPRSFGSVFTCGPGDIIEVDCILFAGNFNVTYTITLETIESETTFYSYGVFTASQGYQYSCDFTR